MTLLVPAALWFSLVGLAVLALYLLKIKRHRETVPDLEFWRQLVSETQVRSLFQRLKRWLSLLLWLAIVTCFVLALGNPIIKRGRMKAESMVVIIDNSASMQAHEDDMEGKTRLQLAKEAALDLTRRRPVNDDRLLLEAGRQPRVVQAFTRDAKPFVDAVGSLAPRRESANLKAAVAIADQVLEGRPDPRIVIISDGATGEVQRLAAADPRIVHWPVGKTTNNIGITRFRVRSLRQRGEHHAYVRVLNASGQAIDTQLVFSIDETTAKVEPLEIEPESVWEKTLVFHHPEGGVLRVAIDDKDVLAVDNEAFAILEPVQPATVFLVTPPDEAFFFERALLAMSELVDAETSQTLTPDSYDSLGELSEQADLTVFSNCLPEGPVSGDAVFVGRWPDDIPAARRGELNGVQMEVANPQHPLMKYVTLRTAKVGRATDVEPLGNVQVLARSVDGGPLMFLHESVTRSSLCVAFDVLETDLPFRNSFPIILRNAITFFGSEHSRWVRPDYEVGEVVQSLRALPDDVTEVKVGRMSDKGIVADVIGTSAERFRFDDTGQPGPLRLEIGNETAYACVNLTDESETRLSPADPPPVDAQLALSNNVGRTVPWLAFAAIGALLITGEWFTYHHRWTE